MSTILEEAVMSVVAKNIAMYRRKFGLSQENLAEKINVSRQTISKWENGSCEPDIAKLLILSDLFKVPVDMIISENSFYDSKKSYRKMCNSEIIFVSGYNVSGLIEEIAHEGDFPTILYDDFPGIIFYETCFTYGACTSKDDSSLKELFYAIAKECVGLNKQSTMCLVTKKDPALMTDFLSWLEEFMEGFNIGCMYVVHELNEDYEYSYGDEVRLFKEDTYEERWDPIYERIKYQNYKGPFPPAKLYRALIRLGLEDEIPDWFMNGI